MPACARKGDVCTGHGCHPPRVSTSGSGDVFVNGIPIHRVGDSWAVHQCGDNVHAGSLAEGSPNVFANGIPVGRIGDSIDCGSAVSQGSPNVFVN